MSSEFTTPNKLESISPAPTPDTVKHIKVPSIFSASSLKGQASPLSENRYKSPEPNLIDKTVERDSDYESEARKSIKIHSYTQESRLPLADPKSICILTKENRWSEARENAKAINHLRNASDADSVVYIGSDDRQLYEINSNYLGIGEIKQRQSIIPEEISGGESLAVLENAPCMAYCKYCKIDVHTEVEFYTTKISKGLMKAFSSIFSCCSMNGWVDGYRVHKCPNCLLIIAKCR